MLGISASRIRVIACPNGGGFGGKSDVFPHEIAVCKMAMKLGRPVKITEPIDMRTQFGLGLPKCRVVDPKPPSEEP